MVKNTLIQRQTERLKRGEINRRRFIMSALATGVTLPTATSLAQRAEAAQSKAGGAARIGIADPVRHAEIQILASANTLLEIDPRGRLIGDLAETYEATRGAQRWVISLRKDVKFHDGSTLDADIVVAALTNAQAPSIRGQVASLRADGPNTVIFDLNRPNPNFGAALSDPALAVRNLSGSGSGAYLADRDTRRMQRRDDYWKDGRGHFDTLELVPLPDPAERLTALLNGEIEMMDDVDPAVFALLAHTPEIALIKTKEASLYGVARRNGAEERLGRKLIDPSERRDLAQKVLLGHGQPRGCADCGPRPSDASAISVSPRPVAFPGGREMMSLVNKMAQMRGHRVISTESMPHFQAERVRLRATLDWTLSEIAAKRPDTKLDALILKVRACQSTDESATLQEQALSYLEKRGYVYPLIADDIHAHRSTMSVPAGTFDPLRIAERGWMS